MSHKICRRLHKFQHCPEVHVFSFFKLFVIIIIIILKFSDFWVCLQDNYHAGIWPVFLRKTGTIFHESSFDLVQKYFCLYIRKRENSIVHIVLHTLQKYIYWKCDFKWRFKCIWAAHTVYNKHCLMKNIVSHFVIVHSIYTNMK